MPRFLFALMGLWLLIFAPPLTAQNVDAASGFDELVRALPEGSYRDRADIATEMAATGDPRAADVLRALEAGDLYRLETGAIAADKGTSGVDVLNGARLEDPEDAGEKIRVNNGLRRVIRDLLATINLTSADDDKRLRAAMSAFRDADPDTLPALETARGKEGNEEIAEMFDLAIAAATLESDRDTEAKLEAIDTLGGAGTRAKAVLERASEDPELADAAQDALDDIALREKLSSIAQNLTFGLSLGSVLLLAAIGLAITFGVMGIINMAHGEMIMLGAYTTFVVQQALTGTAFMPYALALAVPAAFLVSGAVGVLIERTIVRHLYGRALETLLATWGVSLILQQAIRMIFGPNNRQVSNPDWMSGAFDILGFQITWSRLWIFIFALVVFFILLIALKRTLMGLQMRAVTQNRDMAADMGIRTGRVDAMTMGLGSGIAGVAGVALSQIDNVSPNLGQSYIVDSFMVVVFGGAGNLWGAFAGAFTLGIGNKLLEPWVGAVLAKILILVFIILFIQKRPRGLFAVKGRFIES